MSTVYLALMILTGVGLLLVATVTWPTHPGRHVRRPDTPRPPHAEPVNHHAAPRAPKKALPALNAARTA